MICGACCISYTNWVLNPTMVKKALNCIAIYVTFYANEYQQKYIKTHHKIRPTAKTHNMQRPQLQTYKITLSERDLCPESREQQFSPTHFNQEI